MIYGRIIHLGLLKEHRSMKKLILGFACLLATTTAFPNSLQNFYLGAYGGYGAMSGTSGSTGDYASGQFALGWQYNKHHRIQWGAETGIQSGNTMNLGNTNQGLPLNATLKPSFDFLATLKAQLFDTYPVFGILKFGFDYEQVDLNSVSSSQDTVNNVNPELEAGFGYNITPRAMITAFYQGIYSGGNANVGTDINGNPTIGRVPTQNAGFIGIEYSF